MLEGIITILYLCVLYIIGNALLKIKAVNKFFNYILGEEEQC